MSAPDFPNHSGGVIQVAHAGRWGAVPEALLEDSRLSLDSRAVAAWLAIKANGWIINIAALRRAIGGERPLGKEKWLRIAKELEGAGYFRRSCAKGPGGRWIWTITFSAVVGFADHGEAAAGRPATGKADHKTKPPKPAQSKPSPLPPPSVGSGGDELFYPKLSAPERAALDDLLAGCTADLRQPILDELAGAQRQNRLRVGVVPFCRALVLRAAENRFSSSLGVAVAAARARQATEKAAAASAPFVPDEAAQAVGERIVEKIRARCAREQTV